MSRELTQKIRRLCNHPWKRELILADKIKWTKLWASVDLIYDTNEAIDFYESIDESKFKEGGYLYVYGVLQALFVQQDAASDLNIALFGEKIDYKKEYSALNKIREHRNDSIGHPTQRKNDTSFHVIDGTSIIKSGFNLVSHFPKKDKSFQIDHINITNCISTQNTLITTILENVMDKLKLDFEQHKKTFKGDPLIGVVGNNLDYSISKLYEFESPLLAMNYKIISETYEEIKVGIKKRYSNLRALPGVQLTCERIDYILHRLQNDLIETINDNEIELEIFIDALGNHFEELIEMVKEIDLEFNGK